MDAGGDDGRKWLELEGQAGQGGEEVTHGTVEIEIRTPPAFKRFPETLE